MARGKEISALVLENTHTVVILEDGSMPCASRRAWLGTAHGLHKGIPSLSSGDNSDDSQDHQIL